MQLHADSFEIQAANLFNGNGVGILFKIIFIYNSELSAAQPPLSRQKLI